MIVDRVLMAGYDKNSRIETSGFWITKYNDLAENPRNYASRYVIAPILEKLKDYSNKEKIAVVGTPCQIRAISNWGGIQNNKVFRIGITCSGGMSYKATEQYKQIQHCKTGKMYYRGDGWPGKNSLQENEMTIEFDHLGSLFEVMFSSQIFKNPACRECHDHFAEYADISLCDFWNSEERIKEKEGKKILSKIKDNSYVIALAIDGKNLSSEELAETINKLGVRGISNITFVIGGSLGLSDEVLSRADYKLSFSKMTFPHQLMRLILLEQVYRAYRINNGEPYHK